MIEIAIIRFIFGVLVVVCFTALLASLSVLITTHSNYEKAKEKEIKKDIDRFGQCCGLETGVCTFKPRLDKLNKLEISEIKNEKISK